MCTHHYGIAQCKVGGELQMPQPHASHRAGAVALHVDTMSYNAANVFQSPTALKRWRAHLSEPALYAHAVIGMACSNHYWVRHQLLHMPCMLFSACVACMAHGANPTAATRSPPC